MTLASHDLIRLFFATMPGGKLHTDMFTPNFAAWTCSQAVEVPGAQYLEGLKVLQSVFPGGLHYTIDTLIAEDDRVSAEVHSQGVLSNGVAFANFLVFNFRIEAGKIAYVREYFNPAPVVEKVVPLMRAAMAKPAT